MEIRFDYNKGIIKFYLKKINKICYLFIYVKKNNIMKLIILNL